MVLCFIFQMVEDGGLGGGLSLLFRCLPVQVLHGLSLPWLEN